MPDRCKNIDRLDLMHIVYFPVLHVGLKNIFKELVTILLLYFPIHLRMMYFLSATRVEFSKWGSVIVLDVNLFSIIF